MKLLGYDVPLGISVTSHKPEEIESFVKAGFTHFEVGIKARMPDPNPLAKSPAERRKNPHTYDEIQALCCRGNEEQLVNITAPVADAVLAQNLCVWSVHLPFGSGWDIAHYDERFRADAVSALKRVIDITSKWNPKVFVIHGCLEPVELEERPVRMAHSIQSIQELETYAKKLGAHLALENLPRSCLGNNTIETTAMAMAAGVSVCFDVNHLLIDSHENFLNSLEQHIITTHISDSDGKDDRHWLPGEGVVPFKMILQRLQNSGYRGPYLFELKKDKNGNTFSPEKVIDSFKKALGE